MNQDQAVSAITKVEFNPATLGGSFVALNGSGTTDAVGMWKLFNGSTTVSIELSFDGVNAHDFIPPQGTFVADFQSNNDNTASYGSAVKKLRKGQIIYGRQAPNPTYLQIIGYK